METNATSTLAATHSNRNMPLLTELERYMLSPAALHMSFLPELAGSRYPRGTRSVVSYLAASITTAPASKSAGRRNTPSLPGFTLLPFTRALLTGPLPLISSFSRPCR